MHVAELDDDPYALTAQAGRARRPLLGDDPHSGPEGTSVENGVGTVPGRHSRPGSE